MSFKARSSSSAQLADLAAVAQGAHESEHANAGVGQHAPRGHAPAFGRSHLYSLGHDDSPALRGSARTDHRQRWAIRDDTESFMTKTNA
jgi:hypothetical protein